MKYSDDIGRDLSLVYITKVSYLNSNLFPFSSKALSIALYFLNLFEFFFQFFIISFILLFFIVKLIFIICFFFQI